MFSFPPSKVHPNYGCWRIPDVQLENFDIPCMYCTHNLLQTRILCHILMCRKCKVNAITVRQMQFQEKIFNIIKCNRVFILGLAPCLYLSFYNSYFVSSCKGWVGAALYFFYMVCWFLFQSPILEGYNFWAWCIDAAFTNKYQIFCTRIAGVAPWLSTVTEVNVVHRASGRNMKVHEKVAALICLWIPPMWIISWFL